MRRPIPLDRLLALERMREARNVLESAQSSGRRTLKKTIKLA
ncbi:hypothetical protein [Brevibacillus sp. NL20B1]|jgi:hypothetical protein|nr:hypothetical protein [Brevibacillus sp. NL20B1]